MYRHAAVFVVVAGLGLLALAQDKPSQPGPTAIVRVTAERGAWDFKISLDPSGKIAGSASSRATASCRRGRSGSRSPPRLAMASES